MLDDFKIAIGNYKKFDILANRKIKDVTKYIIVLILVCSIGLIAVPMFTLVRSMANIFMEDIPEFVITENGLETDGEFEFEFGGVKVYATTKKELSKDDFGDNISGILLDKDSVILRNVGKISEFSYDEFGDEGQSYRITKSDLLKLKPYIFLICILIYFAMLFINIFTYVIGAAFMGLIALIISTVLSKQMSVENLIIASLYAKTLPLILSSIFMMFGINFSSIVGFVISMSIIIMYIMNKDKADME